MRTELHPRENVRSTKSGIKEKAGDSAILNITHDGDHHQAFPAHQVLKTFFISCNTTLIQEPSFSLPISPAWNEGKMTIAMAIMAVTTSMSSEPFPHTIRSITTRSHRGCHNIVHTLGAWFSPAMRAN
jgi:hypothetical protein